MNLSVGLLYDCQKFIGLCDAEAFLIEDVQATYRDRYEVAPIGTVLDLLREAHWVSFDDDGRLRLTKRGQEILACKDAIKALRLQIMDFILFFKPTWSGLIPKGRNETLPFLPSDARQCFREAGLAEGYDEPEISFWDRAADISRGRTDHILLEIGRQGERLSIAHEKERTKRTPIYKAIDSNLAGYDLLSIVDANNTTPLKIEVKATRKIDDRVLYLTRNEWDCALGPGDWVLHMWVLNDPPLLIKATRNVVAAHVSVDRGHGSWQSIKMSLGSEAAPFGSSE